MECINFDKDWVFRRAFVDSLGMIESDPGEVVNLPHDGMIVTQVKPDAAAKYDSGYFEGGLSCYTKNILIPEEWKNECIGLKFDGVMMHSTIEVNGSKVSEHHYGYSPFYVDITDYVSYGVENRITINVNTGVQPSSRWYSGSGLYRSVGLCHSPKVHIVNDGIYMYTKSVEDDIAFLEATVDICNATCENRLVEVAVELYKDGSDTLETMTKRVIQVNPRTNEIARMNLNLKNPALWDAENPNLYNVKVKATDLGIYRTHFVRNESCTTDEAATIFGVRTITVDAVRGLRINGKTTKLKGGCLHHDNGLLGAISLYESEVRRLKKLKEIGFNAIRTAHNPPSAALVEACDRVGMYIFDEAFDAWGMAKRPGDYSMFFESQWESDLTAFVKRDRIHPSVILWSTGNEIPERGGLNNGYTVATRIAEKVRSLDASRPISNGICSFWSGLDDYLAKGQNQSQNAKDENLKITWEQGTEPFTNGLDVVGYNYMEDLYEPDHEMYPERVMLGSENFPKEIGFRWPLVESLPYVIGEFTWTAWDYIGEAGIGKSLFADADDPVAKKKPWEIMPPSTSPFPWRTSNDADVDITGRLLPQGAYRSVVWGSEKTHVFVQHPQNYGKVEVISLWGFINIVKSWNFAGYEEKPVDIVVFSNGDEVELLVNGKSLGKKAVSHERPLPKSVHFDTVYAPGKVEAISYRNGVEISRDVICTSKAPAKLVLTPEKTEIKADGKDVAYIGIDVLDEDGNLVTDGAINLTASFEGAGYLAAFGTGNPVTSELYSENTTVSYRGHAMAIIRSNYEAGKAVLSVSAEGVKGAACEILLK